VRSPFFSCFSCILSPRPCQRQLFRRAGARSPTPPPPPSQLPGVFNPQPAHQGVFLAITFPSLWQRALSRLPFRQVVFVFSFYHALMPSSQTAATGVFFLFGNALCRLAIPFFPFPFLNRPRVLFFSSVLYLFPELDRPHASMFRSLFLCFFFLCKLRDA